MNMITEKQSAFNRSGTSCLDNRQKHFTHRINDSDIKIIPIQIKN
jgi:hypothetical protein